MTRNKEGVEILGSPHISIKHLRHNKHSFLLSKIYVLFWNLVFLMVRMDSSISIMHPSKSYSSEETVGKKMKSMFPGRKIIGNIWQNEIG